MSIRKAYIHQAAINYLVSGGTSVLQFLEDNSFCSATFKNAEVIVYPLYLASQLTIIERKEVWFICNPLLAKPLKIEVL